MILPLNYMSIQLPKTVREHSLSNTQYNMFSLHFEEYMIINDWSMCRLFC